MTLPVSYLFVEYVADSGRIKDLDFLYTMRARIVSTWPEIWTMFSKQGSYILGMGMGGVGVAQQIYAPDLWVPTDNLYIYVFGHTGIMGIILLFLFALRVVSLKYWQGQWSLLLACYSIVILTYGVTNNILQGGFLSFTFGMLLSGVFARLSLQSREKTKKLVMDSERDFLVLSLERDTRSSR